LARIGVDVGGTFTDLILMDEGSGQVSVHKTQSTPQDTSVGVTNGVLEICKMSEVPHGSVDLLFYGTTEATNIVVEHKGASMGMITTEGFRDIVHIGRQKRFFTYSILVDQPWQKDPLVLRRNRLTVPERIDSHGNVLRKLDEEGTRAAATALRSAGVQSVAICFLNSYVNPEHELRARSLVLEEFPEAHVSLSHEVVNQYREYERFSTTCLNAYIAPIVGKHVDTLRERLAGHDINPKIMLMQSNGGTTTTTWARERPVSLLMSGPAAGLISGIEFAGLADVENIITVDVGGTTADFGVAPGRTLRYKHLLDTKIRGYAAMIPMLDMDTIGAGGGSLAFVDEGGAFRVGPQSAGAVPGPACYGLGGTQPTVTDAHLVMKRLNPAYLLGGRLKVQPDKSESALRSAVCKPLGMGVEEAALGTVKIANHNMVQALELNITGRGYDPRDFSLMAFGGAGPLHACELARHLSIPRVIIPPVPGITSAIGLLLTDVLYTESKTAMQNSSFPDLARLGSDFASLEKEVYERLKADGFPEGKIAVSRFAECRYVGQSYELRVGFDSGRVTRASMANLLKSFHKAHHREYSLSFPEKPIEIVHIHVVGRGLIRSLRWKKILRGDRSPAKARKDVRETLFEVGGKPKWVKTTIYERGMLKAGNVIRGPAIVEQKDATSVIDFNCKAKVDGYGNMLVEVRQ
jgi:N-methylhydantoinase A/oxoprolinase/acetone carboxylase beta subunit